MTTTIAITSSTSATIKTKADCDSQTKQFSKKTCLFVTYRFTLTTQMIWFAIGHTQHISIEA